jgi:deazaflavin-dependent oxidoreductase (nitroreductase family)
MIELGAWRLKHGHRALLAVTRGRFRTSVAGMQPVELYTTGRRSDVRRSTMLTAPICEERRVVLVASKGGHRDHPQWYQNLVANPEVELAINGNTRTAALLADLIVSAAAIRACAARPDEKSVPWPSIVARYRG